MEIKVFLEGAEARQKMWEEIASDPQAIKDRNITRESALRLANYFEGRADAFREVYRDKEATQ